MIKYYFPVLLVACSNVLYDISAKTIPSDQHALGMLVITYATAALCSLILFYITSKEKSLTKELKKINWAVFVMVAGICGIDLGYIFLFRAGWPISLGPLVCNIGQAIVLIMVGILFYKEKLTKDHVAGICFCLAGFILINA